jgi:lysophospholipase L1-like esterase
MVSGVTSRWRRRWRRRLRRLRATDALLVVGAVVVCAFVGFVALRQADAGPVVDEPSVPLTPSQGHGLLVIGDSWVTGGPMNPAGQEWPELLDLPDDWTLRTDAVGGSGYVGFTHGNDLRTSGRLDEILSTYVPDTVLVALGDNDTIHPVGRVVREARYALMAMRDRWPDAQIVVFSPWSPGEPQPSTVALTAALGDLADELGLAFLDVSHATDQPGLIGSDDHHPNDAGHRALADFVQAGLARLGVAPFGQ